MPKPHLMKYKINFGKIEDGLKGKLHKKIFIMNKKLYYAKNGTLEWAYL